jgi:high-affinity iron transporter
MITGFIITFRESLEAALIIGIMAAVLTKMGRKSALRYLYSGILFAIAASLILGAIVFRISGTLRGTSEQIFEGVAAFTASIVLTYMIFWMSRNARNISSELQRKVELSLSRGDMVGIAGISFFSVFREGAETVLFLSAIFSQDRAGTIIGATAGMASVLALSLLMFKGVSKMNTRKFFSITGFMLILFSAGLVALGTHEFIEAGLLPAGIEDVWDINPPLNPDGTYPLLHEKGILGSLLASLFGYNGNPDLTEVLAYVSYWIIIGAFLISRNFFSLIKSSEVHNNQN